MDPVHTSPFAGTWYPDDAAGLRRMLDERFEVSRSRTGSRALPGALAFVVPHASPLYSGTVASAVYRAIQEDRPERIVVLGFPHRGGLRGIAVSDAAVIATPLGEVTVERVPGFPVVAEDRLCDHSFEIQLPFLQTAVPQARILPVYVGGMSASGRREGALRLAALWEPGTVFLASSDFTHYGRDFRFTPFPADHEVANRLRQLDFECIDAAGSIDSGLFRETLAENGATVCGADPIALLLDVISLLAADSFQSVLDYQTSGEIGGDFRHSVSYAALAYHRRAVFDLDAPDREVLLDAAVGTLDRLQRTGRREAVPVAGGSTALNLPRGVFVCLHRGEELLGCLGNYRGREPIAVEAPELVLAAALDDPRFQPACEGSGPIDIEISVLTPMRRIRGADSFRLGRHGALLKLGGRRGLLLPQVAGNHDWTAEEYLAAVARKGMLGPRAWRDPRAQLFVFEAQVFSRPGLRGQS